MDVYSTEEEQMDAVRRFLKENGKAIAIGVVIGLGGLFAWRYWSSHQANSLVQASVQYEKLSATLTDKSSSADLAAVEKFIADNKNSYGVFATLRLAEQYVKNAEYEKAAAQLKQVPSLTKDENLQAVSALRLARIQLQLKQFDDGIKTLESVKAPGWVAQAHEIRGDILLSKGDAKGARQEYSAGIESSDNQSLRTLLDIKLNNISS